MLIMKANPDSLATQAYQLQLEWQDVSVDRYIIAKCWRSTTHIPATLENWWDAFKSVGKKIHSGVAIVYSEFDLLWLTYLPGQKLLDRVENVRRVTFVCAPHRGSRMALAGPAGFFATLIRLPQNITGTGRGDSPNIRFAVCQRR